MNEKQTIPESQVESGLCEIRLKGHLSDLWADQLGNCDITLEENGNTLLTCQVLDQAALHGLFKRVRDLGLPLLSINFVNPRNANTEEVES